MVKNRKLGSFNSNLGSPGNDKAANVSIRNFQISTFDVDSPVDCNPGYNSWEDSVGRTCEYYRKHQYCRADGTQGRLWTSVANSNETFDSYQANGYTAVNCPQCGCSQGMKYETRNHKASKHIKSSKFTKNEYK